MPMRDQIISFLKSRKKLYTLVRCLQKLGSPDLARLIAGYYDAMAGETSLLIEHPGKRDPDITVYYSTIGVEQACVTGFFANLRFQLESLYFSERLGMVPVVHWGEGILDYYDAGMDEKTTNVFEYYFLPVSNISYLDVAQYRNLVRSRSTHATCFSDMGVGSGKSYLADSDMIAKLGGIYKKYIRLNAETKAYFEKELGRIFTGKKTLGVHVRGTDYYQTIKNHPVPVSPQEFVEQTKKLFADGKYEQVFLATDDANVTGLFSEAFSDGLVYFEDTFRSDSHIGPHSLESDRPLHHYMLGLEVLRDAYALACCDGFLAGVSQVSIAARTINVALGRAFSDVVIIDKGLEKESGSEAVRELGKLRKKEKQFNRRQDQRERSGGADNER